MSKYKVAAEFSEFSEEDLNLTLSELAKETTDALDELQDASNKFIDESQEDISDYIEEKIDDVGDLKVEDLIVPGSNSKALTEEDINPVTETDYENDGDLSKFMKYIKEMYPSKIPRHDGSSVLGCEKAIAFLDALSKEILRNIKLDTDDQLDVVSLESVNNNIVADILTLKNHAKNLKRKMQNERDSKVAFNENEIVKVAATPNNIVISVTPFVRAICGILINSCVSAGKPFEEVYDHLKGKYDITPREELEILQVLMDYGQPIFKDRGSMPIPANAKEMGKLKDQEKNLSGIDFVTSYFA